MWITICAFLCWYIPISYVNVFACDDFWFGSNVHQFGFWGTQSYYWHYWEGSYTHTFLASLPHVIEYSHVPFICNMCSMTLLIASCTILFRSFFTDSVQDALLGALYLVSVLYFFTIGEAEIRFWVCANFTYIIELSALIAFLSLYHVIENKKTKLWLFPSIFLLFIIAGSKLTFLSFTYFSMIIHDILFRSKISKSRIILFAILFLFTLINILAPGNLIRLHEETEPKEISISLIESFIYRFKYLLIIILHSSLVFPLLSLTNKKLIIEKRKIALSTVLLIVAFIVESAIMYVCFNDPGPVRVYIIFECMVPLFLLLILVLFRNQLLGIKVIRLVALLCVLITIGIKGYSISRQIKPSIFYSQKATERDQLVLDSDSDHIQLSALPESHLLLSYFSNDPGWIENVYLPYFGKTCEVELIQTDLE